MLIFWRKILILRQCFYYFGAPEFRKNNQILSPIGPKIAIDISSLISNGTALTLDAISLPLSYSAHNFTSSIIFYSLFQVRFKKITV